MSLIKLSNILKEISEIESERILSKIRNKNFQFFDSGDNGKVYTIDGEDLLMKITSEPDNKNMYIMKRASKLSPDMYTNIDNFYEGYKDYARQQGVETSIFEYFNNNGARNINQKLASFLSALEQQVKDTGIGDLELSLDFKPDNIMSWNGNLVMVDW